MKNLTKVFDENGKFLGYATNIVVLRKGKINFFGLGVIDIEYYYKDIEDDYIYYTHQGTQYMSYYKHLII